MRRVIIYVEGPSDRLGLSALLQPLINLKKAVGVRIDIVEAPDGDRKEALLVKIPQRAVNILRNDLSAEVVIIPDLYPKNKAFPHENLGQLTEGVFNNLENAIAQKGIAADSRIRERFKVFCFKHDFEVLILSSKDALKRRVGILPESFAWKIPVEDQNHDNPPKKIVEAIFNRAGSKYQGTIDAPLILSSSSYQEIAANCTQCFRPFIDYLEGLQ